jgi:hypothetical protein
MTQGASHHSTETIKRSAAQSATARIAYICRTQITDDRTGEHHRYTDKDRDLDAVQVVGYDGTPAQFANALEAAEKRKDAQVGRSSILALPNDLDADASARVLLAYQQHLHKRYGCASVSALHRKHGNNHAHVVESTRDGNGAKIDILSNKRTSRTEIEHRRKTWADIVNNELSMSSPSTQKVDHRSLERRARSGDREAAGRAPEPHHGPARHAVLKSGAKAPKWAVQRIKDALELTRAMTELRNAQKLVDTFERIKTAAARKLSPPVVQKRRTRRDPDIEI